MVAIVNGLIHDAVNPQPYIADILVDNGKIKAIGKDVCSKDCDVIDASGLEVFPGFIDAHTHIGMFGVSNPNSKDDVEKYQRTIPENRAIDGIDPQNSEFDRARRGGVTTVCIPPGSVNIIGGSAVILKTAGRYIDEMIVKDPAAIKVAFGENPKAKLLAPITSRMTISSIMRKELYRALDYKKRKEAANGDESKMPAFDLGLEALLPVMNREIPLKAHVQRASDIMNAIRIAKEFNIKMTLEHVHDGDLIADVLAKEGYPICCGPYSSYPQKSENRRSDPHNAAVMINAGCHVSIMTDSCFIRQDFLPLCAGLLIREGIDEETALKTITINAAEHIGVENRVGSIEVGKDADIVIAKGNPLKMGQIKTVLINGEVVTN